MERRLKIFIGYDSNEVVAFHTLVQSIMETTTIPYEIVPLIKNKLSCYKRKPNVNESTEFSFTRFLVPYLSNYSGMSIFMDCDMLVLTDLKLLIENIDCSKAISVVKHDYIPKEETKFLGKKQKIYNRKNWSSLIVWNNEHEECKTITPEVVNSASAKYLHEFGMINDNNIGSIDKSWNWLVGEYSYNKNVNIIHWTLGGPYFKEYKNTEYSDNWEHMLNIVTSVKNT